MRERERERERESYSEKLCKAAATTVVLYLE